MKSASGSVVWKCADAATASVASGSLTRLLASPVFAMTEGVVEPSTQVPLSRYLWFWTYLGC